MLPSAIRPWNFCAARAKAVPARDRVGGQEADVVAVVAVVVAGIAEAHEEVHRDAPGKGGRGTNPAARRDLLLVATSRLGASGRLGTSGGGSGSGAGSTGRSGRSVGGRSRLGVFRLERGRRNDRRDRQVFLVRCAR